MRVPVHASMLYQHPVDTARGQSFIPAIYALRHIGRMATQPLDTAFGERLKAAIRRAGFKSDRRFALDGLKWDASNGPQRLSNYIKGRIPDAPTLRQIAAALSIPPSELLSGDDGAGLRDILLHLLELEGIDRDRSDTIASVFLEAKRLLETFPDEAELPTRARFAAHAAWQQQR